MSAWQLFLILSVIYGAPHTGKLVGLVVAGLFLIAAVAAAVIEKR